MKNTETTVLEIETRDGRTFRVFCANRSQFDRAYNATKKLGAKFRPITNGLHTVKQFEKILETI